jgi:Bacterial Ig-like domain (group 2)
MKARSFSDLGVPWRSRRLTALLAVTLAACGGNGSTEVAVVRVDVAPASALIVGVGETVAFNALARDGIGTLISGNAAEWSVANPEVATISASGLATGVSAGETTVTATLAGARGTARLEVYLPPEISSYEPGTSYLGRRGYAEYIPGRLPVVLSAPHGGDLEPDEIPDRTFGVTGTDRNTVELTLAVRDALMELTGFAPHVILSHLHRRKLDPNREIVEAAQGSPFAEEAWREFQGFIDDAESTVAADFGRGMYFDMHGHGHDIDRVELGYLLSADDLNRSDSALDLPAVVASSSIRDLGAMSPLPFSALLRGPTSLGGLLGARGVRSVPSPGDPSPGSDAYFSGGFNTREHGSRDEGGVVSGIQLEHQFPGLRDTDENRRVYAAQLASAIRDYMLEHYGFFEPGGA